MNGQKEPPSTKPLLNSHRVSKLIFSASSSRWIWRGPVVAVLIGSSTHAARGRSAHTPLYSLLCVCVYMREEQKIKTQKRTRPCSYRQSRESSDELLVHPCLNQTRFPNDVTPTFTTSDGALDYDTHVDFYAVSAGE
jgi:hypothetical protein